MWFVRLHREPSTRCLPWIPAPSATNHIVRTEDSTETPPVAFPGVPERSGARYAGKFRGFLWVTTGSNPVGGWRRRGCPRLRLLATIERPAVVRKILSHLGIPTECPEPLPAARSPPGLPGLFDSRRD